MANTDIDLVSTSPEKPQKAMKPKRHRWTDKDITRYDKVSEKEAKTLAGLERITIKQMGHVVNNVDEHLVVNELTRYDLAVAAGIRKHSYRQSWWGVIRNKTLSGEYNPQLRTVLRLSRATGLTLAALLEGYADER